MLSIPQLQTRFNPRIDFEILVLKSTPHGPIIDYTYLVQSTPLSSRKMLLLRAESHCTSFSCRNYFVLISKMNTLHALHTLRPPTIISFPLIPQFMDPKSLNHQNRRFLANPLPLRPTACSSYSLHTQAPKFAEMKNVLFKNCRLPNQRRLSNNEALERQQQQW